MNDLKSAMIFGINHGHADEMLDTLASVMDAYETGGLRELETRLFRLSVDMAALERMYKRNRDYLDTIRQEAEEDERDLWRTYARASKAVGMSMPRRRECDVVDEQYHNYNDIIHAGLSL